MNAVVRTPLRIAILTVSDSAARGERTTDASGDAIATWTSANGHTVVDRATVPDGTVEIVRRLLRWCDGDLADVVFTTGGTGVSPRDVTVDATRAVIEAEMHGMSERMRVPLIESFPRAALSRGIVGVRHRSLVVNLPGSPGGVRDGLAALAPLIEHVVQTIRGSETDHAPAPTGPSLR